MDVAPLSEETPVGSSESPSFIPQAFAQASGSTSATQSTHAPGAAQVDVSALATPAGHEVSFEVAGYEYVDPAIRAFRSSRAQVRRRYTGAMSLNSSQRWFLQADARGLLAVPPTMAGVCLLKIAPDNGERRQMDGR